MEQKLTTWIIKRTLRRKYCNWCFATFNYTRTERIISQLRWVTVIVRLSWQINFASWERVKSNAVGALDWVANSRQLCFCYKLFLPTLFPPVLLPLSNLFFFQPPFLFAFLIRYSYQSITNLLFLIKNKILLLSSPSWIYTKVRSKRCR